MEYRRILEGAEALRQLQIQYKRAIGEESPSDADFGRLFEAIAAGRILFYGGYDGERLVACCSVCPTFSTFNYRPSGVFEDFYIVPEYRHKGIARALARFAFEASGAASLTVGCADVDVEMYRAIGFSVPLGNLLAMDE